MPTVTLACKGGIVLSKPIIHTVNCRKFTPNLAQSRTVFALRTSTRAVFNIPPNNIGLARQLYESFSGCRGGF